MSINLIIKSIINFANDEVVLQTDSSNYNNRIQNMGNSFENYVKELFLDETNYKTQQKIQKFAEIFSWQGSANNPPDLILRNSFAIEVKKKESKKGSLALNSSYPKNSIFSEDSKLSRDCSIIDGGSWNKDLFYYIFEASNKQVKSLFIIDGKCYCADKQVYSKIFDNIKKEIFEIKDLEFRETK